jgi:hypothetical protein
VHFPPLLKRAQSVWPTRLNPTTVCLREPADSRSPLRSYNEPVVPSSDASPQSSTWVIALEVMFHA